MLRLFTNVEEREGEAGEEGQSQKKRRSKISSSKSRRKRNGRKQLTKNGIAHSLLLQQTQACTH